MDRNLSYESKAKSNDVEDLTFSRQLATDDDEVVSLRRLPHFYPREDSWYSFLLEAKLTPGT
jgi:hypothetical protein